MHFKGESFTITANEGGYSAEFNDEPCVGFRKREDVRRVVELTLLWWRPKNKGALMRNLQEEDKGRKAERSVCETRILVASR